MLGASAGAGAVAALVALPLLGASGYLITVLLLTFLYASLASSWNLISGFTGYVSFGHAAFYGVGAYTTAILLARRLTPWPVALPPGRRRRRPAGARPGLPRPAPARPLLRRRHARADRGGARRRHRRRAPHRGREGAHPAPDAQPRPGLLRHGAAGRAHRGDDGAGRHLARRAAPPGHPGGRDRRRGLRRRHHPPQAGRVLRQRLLRRGGRRALRLVRRLHRPGRPSSPAGSPCGPSP